VQEQLAAARRDAANRSAAWADASARLTAANVEVAALEACVAEMKASLSWKLTSPVRRLGRPVRGRSNRRMINLAQIRHHRLETDPYEWAAVGNLFSPEDAASLSATYPCDRFKLVAGYDKEKGYEYEARALIGMGAGTAAHPEELSEAWRQLAAELCSAEYRAAMSALTGRDLMHVPIEVNVFHYGPGAALGPHKDLADKLVTHVLYFNRSWNTATGGCLRILRSQDPADVKAEIPPIVGYSAVIVRSDKSWHEVTRVVGESTCSRRSMTVTFYRPGSVSTMWPPGDTTPLHRYHAADLL